MSTLAVDKATNVAGTQYYNLMLLGTSQSATGDKVNFTSIPNGVKRITVMFDGVSTSGGSNILVQLGDSGGVEDSSYRGSSTITSGGVASSVMTSGILVYDNSQSAADISSGVITILNITGNTWVFQGNVGLSNTNEVRSLAGAKTLSATLDRIRITTVNGTDTFDAGTINLLYEGYKD